MRDSEACVELDKVKTKAKVETSLMNQNLFYNRRCVNYIAEQWFLDHEECIQEYDIEIDDEDVLLYYKSFVNNLLRRKKRGLLHRLYNNSR